MNDDIDFYIDISQYSNFLCEKQKNGQHYIGIGDIAEDSREGYGAYIEFESLKRLASGLNDYIARVTMTESTIVDKGEIA